MDVNRLKGKIAEKNLNVSVVAKELGMARSSFYRKLNSKGERLTVREANNLVSILELNAVDAIAIFFGNDVAFNAN